MANFEATNTVKQGKNAKRTNGTHFTRVRGGGSIFIGNPRRGGGSPGREGPRGPGLCFYLGRNVHQVGDPDCLDFPEY